MKAFKKTALLFFVFLLFFAGGMSIEAMEADYPEIGGLRPVFAEEEGFSGYVLYIAQFLIGLALIITVLALVKGGILLMTSAGDPLKIRNSKEQFSAALMGLLIVLSSFVFLSAIDPKLLKLEELEVIEIEETHPSGIYFSLEETFPEEIKEEDEDNIYRTTSPIRNLEELRGRIRSVRIVNQTGQEGELIGYYYGVILHEDPAFRGKCEFFMNEGSEPLDFSVSGNVSSISVVRIDENPPEEGGVTAYERPDFRDDYPSQSLGRFTKDFRPLNISEVWSLDIEGNYGVVLASGNSWGSMQDGCGILLDAKPISDLKGHHMNKCNPRKATPFFAAYESCASHYLVFPLFQ